MHGRTRPPERLAFTFNTGTVPPRGLPTAVVRDYAQRPASPPTAASVPQAPSDVGWDYRGLLVFITILFVRPQDLVPGLGVFHLAELSAVVALSAMVMRQMNRGLPLMRMTPEAKGLLAFGGAILVGVPFSTWPGGALGLFTDSWIKLFIVFVLMMNTMTTPKRLEQVTWLIVLCCGYIAGRSLFDYARGLNLVEGDRLGGPVGGIFGNPNDLAMNLVTFLPAAAVAVLSPVGAASKRRLAAMATGLMLATVILTRSRGGVLGLAAVLLTLMMLGRFVRPRIAVIVIAAALVVSPFMPASFWSRMGTIVDDQKDKAEFTGSREARSTVMLEGIRTFVEHPLTGIGAGQFPNYDPGWRKERWRETHNALIQVAAETGAFGLLAFCFLIVCGARATFATRRMLAPQRHRRDQALGSDADAETDRRRIRALSVALTAGLAGWFVCALFASVAYNWTFYILLALIVATRDVARGIGAGPRVARA